MNIKYFTNPFAILSERKLFIIGMFSFVIGILMAWFLDVNLEVLRFNPTRNISIWTAILKHVFIVGALTLGFFLIGKWVNKKTRLIDILNTVLISLIPLYLTFLQNIGGFLSNKKDEMMLNLKENYLNMPPTSFGFILVSLIISLFFIYYIYLLCTGFKTATNAKKVWHYIVFFVTLILLDLILSYLINSF